MKKTLVYISALMLVMGLSSCDSTTPTSTEPTNEPPVQTEAVKETEKKADTKVIKAGKTEDTSVMTKVFSHSKDVNSDGISDNISLYCSAGANEERELLLDDINKWVLEVTDGINEYTLYKEDISNGNVYAEVAEYYKDGVSIPVISVIKSSNMGLSITNYTYNKSDEGFVEEKIFTTDDLSEGGINKSASSIAEPVAIVVKQ